MAVGLSQALIQNRAAPRDRTSLPEDACSCCVRLLIHCLVYVVPGTEGEACIKVLKGCQAGLSSWTRNSFHALSQHVSHLSSRICCAHYYHILHVTDCLVPLYWSEKKGFGVSLRQTEARGIIIPLTAVASEWSWKSAGNILGFFKVIRMWAKSLCAHLHWKHNLNPNLSLRREANGH